ncbi:hypothetical protein ASF55_20575 [Methylobacterium sp. Leaf119]|nr:hypothetical protein ASF55_20575 [Methylobacterium sp. Leaf119]
MPRWLFETICVVVFAAPIAAACLYAWPFTVGHPLPVAFDTEAVLFVALTLLLSVVTTTLMSVTARPG